MKSHWCMLLHHCWRICFKRSSSLSTLQLCFMLSSWGDLTLTCLWTAQSSLFAMRVCPCNISSEARTCFSQPGGSSLPFRLVDNDIEVHSNANVHEFWIQLLVWSLVCVSTRQIHQTIFPFIQELFYAKLLCCWQCLKDCADLRKATAAYCKNQSSFFTRVLTAEISHTSASQKRKGEDRKGYAAPGQLRGSRSFSSRVRSVFARKTPTVASTHTVTSREIQNKAESNSNHHVWHQQVCEPPCLQLLLPDVSPIARLQS